MGKNVPALRFAGFTDDWEQRKLSEVASSFEYGLNAAAKEYDGVNKYIRITDIDDLSRVFKDDDLTSPDTDLSAASNYKLHDGEILFARTGASVGKSFIYRESDGHVYFAGFLIRAKIKSEYDPEFVFQNTLGVSYEKYIQITSQRSGQPGVNAQEYGEYTFLVPDYTEQKKIGGFLRQLDNLITLHQRKLEGYKRVKKSLLEKMFPKEGKKVPEIRFEGFTEDWEQRKLEDVYGSIGNAFVGTATPYYVEQGHFYLESNNVKDGQINHNSEIFINNEFYEKQKDKWLHTGDMVMVQSGHVGHAAVIPEELNNTAAHALIMFRNPKEEIDSHFLNYEYQTDNAKKKIENITTGNTIKHILASDMQKFVVDVPKHEEQIVIAGYFRSLDDLITLHQRKLEGYKRVKKSLLEKMFF